MWYVIGMMFLLFKKVRMALEKKSSKVGYLDGLRGVACMVVVTDHWFLMGFNDSTSHSNSVLWGSWLLRTPLRLFIDGGFAVAIFLVLSGYVLLVKFFSMQSKGQRHLIWSGMIRRYPRLMIPGFVSLLMYYSWLHFGPFQGYSGCHGVAELTNNQNGTISFDVGGVIFNGLIGQYTFEPAIYSVQWTLQIELLGSWIIYLVALGFVLLPSGDWKKYATYGFAFLLIPILYLIAGYGSAPLPLQYLQSFIVGMGIADLQSSGYLDHIRNLRLDVQTKRYFWTLQGVLLTVALYFGTFPYQVTMGAVSDSMWMPFNWMGPWLWLTMAAGCLMVSLLTLREFQDLLSTSYCHFLGRISFAVYLLHFIVLLLCDVFIMPYLGPATNTDGHDDRTIAAIICYFLIIIPVVIPSSYLFTVYVDEVAIECSRDFYDFWLRYCPVCCSCLKDSGNVPSMTDPLITLSPYDLKQESSNKLPSTTTVVFNNKRTVEETESPLTLREETAKHEGKNEDVFQEYATIYSLDYWRQVDWTGKKMLLIYITLLFLILCCVPGTQKHTCYVDDDNNSRRF